MKNKIEIEIRYFEGKIQIANEDIKINLSMLNSVLQMDVSWRLYH